MEQSCFECKDPFVIAVSDPPIVGDRPVTKTAKDLENVKLAELGQYKIEQKVTKQRLELICAFVHKYQVELPDKTADNGTCNALFCSFMKTLEHFLKQSSSCELKTKDDLPDALVDMFTVSPCETLSDLVADADGMVLARAALDAHMANVVVSNDDKHAEWLEIKRRVAELKARKANIGPFDTPLTPGEERMLIKDALIEETIARGEGSKAREQHYANQNAVSYSWMMGVVAQMFYRKEDSLETLVDTVDHALRYIAVHGSTSTKQFVDSLTRFKSIMTAKNVDIKPTLVELTKHSHWFVAADGGADIDKYTPNHLITVKRLYRLAYIFTSCKNRFTLMRKDLPTMTKLLIKMYNLEKELKFRDAHSLSMIWYYAVGRTSIVSPITDWNDMSGEDALNRALKLPQRGAYGASPSKYVFGSAQEQMPTRG